MVFGLPGFTWQLRSSCGFRRKLKTQPLPESRSDGSMGQKVSRLKSAIRMQVDIPDMDLYWVYVPIHFTTQIIQMFVLTDIFMYAYILIPSKIQPFMSRVFCFCFLPCMIHHLRTNLSTLERSDAKGHDVANVNANVNDLHRVWTIDQWCTRRRTRCLVSRCPMEMGGPVENLDNTVDGRNLAPPGIYRTM